MKNVNQNTNKREAKVAHGNENGKQVKESGQIPTFELRTSGKPAFRLTTIRR